MTCLPTGAKLAAVSSRVRAHCGPLAVFPDGENTQTKAFYQEVSRTVMERIAALGCRGLPRRRITSSAGARNAE